MGETYAGTVEPADRGTGDGARDMTAPGARRVTLERATKETKIRLTLDLDGRGEARISTGIGFFDHMLEGFARHGFFDLEVSVEGDLQVDTHHTIEDTGIVRGQAIGEAVGD